MDTHDTILILDFGSQYAQLIARRIREMNVYCELKPWARVTDPREIPSLRGIILSGGPSSVYAPGAPQLSPQLLQAGVPVLGICYGMQALTHALGGQVEPASEREYGLARLHTLRPNPLIPEGNHQAWMSHGDRIEHIPESFRPLAKTDNSPVAALADTSRHIYGVQFHPEVKHTTIGEEILRRLVREIYRAEPSWTPA